MSKKKIETKFIKAFCNKTKQYYSLEVASIDGEYKVVNMTLLSPKDAKITASELRVDNLKTHTTLIPCSGCGSRVVGGCTCYKRQHSCKKDDNKYFFQCIYCKDFILDYSMPSASDLRGYSGKKIELEQGKEVEITFSNVEWTYFDHVKNHESAGSYRRIEPKVHVIYNENDIEFHGYNVSRMDEGVYYEIGGEDDFSIECNVDTSTIKPHPGGFLSISLGAIYAEINQDGGLFYIDRKKVCKVGSKFKMLLSLSHGVYSIAINGKEVASEQSGKTKNVRITFEFQHGSHNCKLLSHAYINNINMKQCKNSQQ